MSRFMTQGRYDVTVTFTIRVDADSNEEAQLAAFETILTDAENVSHSFEVEPVEVEFD